MEQWKVYRLGDICKINILQSTAKDNWDNALYSRKSGRCS